MRFAGSEAEPFAWQSPTQHHGAVEYDPTQFRGTAQYYLKGRPPYSPDLAEVLKAELELDGLGRLADVGCGPGNVGVELASLFGQVSFVDPDPDMLAEARMYAAAAGLSAVDFHQVTAEELPGLRFGSLRVAAFGQSFHRTDRVRVAEDVYDLLEPGGSIVLIAHNSDRPPPRQPAGASVVPHHQIQQLIYRYLGAELRSGARPATAYGSERFEQTLARTRFGSPRIVFAAGRSDLIRDADEVIANYLSMSFASPHLLAGRLPEFVRDLRTLLHKHAPGGRFWDWPGDTELVIATRP
jgi:SAM-dependent methyltransferase